MSAKNPRVTPVQQESLDWHVKPPVQKDGVPMSAEVRDLLKEVLENQEDIYLARIAEVRESAFKKSSGIPPSHLLTRSLLFVRSEKLNLAARYRK